MGHGFWITRSPHIRKEEWHEFVATRSDLRTPDDSFGEMPEESKIRSNLPEFVWWLSDVPSKVIFSKGAIFVEAAGAEGGVFARAVAEHFGGIAQEG